MKLVKLLLCLSLFSPSYGMLTTIKKQKEITRTIGALKIQPEPTKSTTVDLGYETDFKPIPIEKSLVIKAKQFRKTKQDIVQEMVPSDSDDEEPLKRTKRLKRKALLGVVVLGGVIASTQELLAEEKKSGSHWDHGDVKSTDPRNPEKPTNLRDCVVTEDTPKNQPSVPEFKLGTDTNPYLEALKFAGLYLWDTFTGWKQDKKEEQLRKEKEAQGPEIPDWWFYHYYNQGPQSPLFRQDPNARGYYDEFVKQHGHHESYDEFKRAESMRIGKLNPHQLPAPGQVEPKQASSAPAPQQEDTKQSLPVPSLQQVEQQTKQDPLSQKEVPSKNLVNSSQLPVQQGPKKEEKSLGQKMVETGGVTFADTIAKTLGSRMGNYVADRSEQLLDFMGNQIYNGAIIVGHKAKIALLGKNWEETYDPLEQTKREQIIVNYQQDRDLIAEHQTSLKAAMEYQYEVEKARQAVENEYREYDPKSKRVRVRKEKVAELFVKQYPDIPIDLEQNIIVLDNEFHQVHIDTKTHRFLYEKKSRDEINELYGPKPQNTQFDDEFGNKFEQHYQEFKKTRDWSSKESYLGWFREKLVRPGVCVGTSATLGYYCPPVVVLDMSGIPAIKTMTKVQSAVIDKTLGSDIYHYDSPPSDCFNGPSDQEDDKPEQVRNYTHRDIRVLASSRGYEETTDYKLNPEGEIVFKKKDKHGNDKYVVFDRKGTSGGYWKVYGGHKGTTRLGTYGKDLKRAI